MAFPVESAGAFRVAFRGRFAIGPYPETTFEISSPRLVRCGTANRLRHPSKKLPECLRDASVRVEFDYVAFHGFFHDALQCLRFALFSDRTGLSRSYVLRGSGSRTHFSAYPLPPPLPTLLPDARPKRASVGILTSGREASPRPAKYPSRESEFPFTFRSMERGSMSSESKQGFQRNPILSTNKSSESPDEAYEFQQIRQLISTLYPLPNRHKKESDSKSFCEFGSPPLVFPIV